MADQLIHRPGLQAIAGQRAVLRVPLQQPLALQKAPNPFGDGMRQFAQLGGRRGFHRAKPLERSIGSDDINPIQKQHVVVDVEVQCTAEALDQGHRAGTRPLASEPGLAAGLSNNVTGATSAPVRPASRYAGATGVWRVLRSRAAVRTAARCV